MKRLIVILTTSAALVTAIAVLAHTVGVDEMPRPAWKTDVDTVAGMSKGNLLRILRGEYRDAERDKWSAEDRVESRERQGLDTTDARHRVRELKSLLEQIKEEIEEVKKSVQ